MLLREIEQNRHQSRLGATAPLSVGLVVHDQGMAVSPESKSSFTGLNPLVLQTVIQFLNAPTISDVFGKDHSARRIFYTTTEKYNPELAQRLETNRLRWNSIYEILMIIDLLLPADDRFEGIRAEARNFPVKDADVYNTLGTSEKVEVTQLLAVLTYRLYELLVL